MRKTTPDRLDELLGRLVDGMASAEECRELEEILTFSREARDRYRVFTAVHVQLATGSRQVMPEPARRSGVFLPLAAIAAAVALVGSSYVFWRNFRQEAGAEKSVAELGAVSSPVMAVTACAEGVAWDRPEPAQAGVTLMAGPVTLTAGVLGLDLVGGQTLTVRAPAVFELLHEREMKLHGGEASLRRDEEGDAYIIRVPGGAVVDLGSELSVQVANDGTVDVHVFEGIANASLTGPGNRTREERLLRAGDSVRIAGTLETSQSATASFLRPKAPDSEVSSPAGDAYATVVARSAPLAWWRFERVQDDKLALPESGGEPLVLHGEAALVGGKGRAFLRTDAGALAGFATTERGIAGLDTSAGLTVECLLHPVSEDHGTAIALDEPLRSPPAGGRFAHVSHPPQRLAIERMGRSGSKIGHVHPDFALRAMLRSPAGYDGGINTYSAESHLFHRWIHVAFTHDGRKLCLYLDGRLSDEIAAELPSQGASLRPIIARMQPRPDGEQRQWNGGIDELALFGRALSPAEIRAHYDALGW